MNINKILLFLLCTLAWSFAYADTCTTTFEASGTDSSPTSLVADLSLGCGCGTVNSVTITSAIQGGANCGTWYEFSVSVDGGAAFTSCNFVADITGLTPTSVITITSADIDAFSDNVTIEIVVEYDFTDDGTCPPPPADPSAVCADPNPLCSGLSAEFNANTTGTAEAGNNYGCLTTVPRPSWFYLEVETSGDFFFSLNNTVDLDFALWGPFADVATATSSCGSLGTPVDCSYTGGTVVETPQITGATAGEVYILLVTAYSSTPTSFSVTNEAGTTGTTNCTILEPPVAATCGDCDNPVCSSASLGAVAEGATPSPTFTTCEDYSAAPFVATTASGPVTFTQCYTVPSSSSGTLGFVQQVTTNTGTDANNCSNVLESRVAELFLESGGICSGTSIAPEANPATTASGTYNPEYTGLTPSTNYIACVTTTVTYGGGPANECTLSETCLDYYYPTYPSCPDKTFTAPTAACSAETINWAAGGTCAIVGPAGSGFVVDLFIYDANDDGIPDAGGAPGGYEGGLDVSSPTHTTGAGPAGTAITDKNPALTDAGFDFTCAVPPSVTLPANNTCAPIVYTYFLAVFDYSNDTDADLLCTDASGNPANCSEYAPNCTVERYDVTVYPAPLTVAVTDDGSTCGTPTVELRDAAGTACSTQSGIGAGTAATGTCSSNGDALNYDFSADPIVTALAGAPAGCPLPTLTGTLTCATCSAAPTLTITDPCNCGNGLDLNSDNQNEYAQEVITIFPGTPGYTVTAVSGLFDNAGVALTPATATALITGPDGSGNYTLTAYVPADNAATYSITIQDSASLSDSVSGGPCAPCPSGCNANNGTWNP